MSPGPKINNILRFAVKQGGAIWMQICRKKEIARFKIMSIYHFSNFSDYFYKEAFVE